MGKRDSLLLIKRLNEFTFTLSIPVGYFEVLPLPTKG